MNFDLDELHELTSRQTLPGDVPSASDIQFQVPIYAGDAVRCAERDPAKREALLNEWSAVLSAGPGVLAVRGAVADLGMLDSVTAMFNGIINERGNDGSDHFAPAGANARIWNAHEKLAVREPALFCRYNENAAIAMAAQAWLGPGYQVTAQVNLVRPGGAAQDPHRDYHLGFMDAATLANYPAHVHALSPALTLQAAIAHSDMPIESGPTQLLPFSQLWPPGYAASGDPALRSFFHERFIQLPLQRGDAVFFNPALLHAAGENVTRDHPRMANLLQISSAFGQAMEVVDRDRLCRAIYPTLAQLRQAGELDDVSIENVVASAADGYPFPANLEVSWDGDGIRPPSQADVLRASLAAGDSAEVFAVALEKHGLRRRSH